MNKKIDIKKAIRHPKNRKPPKSWWEKILNNLKKAPPTFWAGEFLFILAMIILIVRDSTNKMLSNYYSVLYLLMIILGIYLIVCKDISKNPSKKIEIGIQLFTAIFLFSAFYMSYQSFVLNEMNRYSVIYADSACPILNSEDGSYYFKVWNADLTKGIPVMLKFKELNNVCLNKGNRCIKEGWITDIPIIIKANESYIFQFKLTKETDDSAEFYMIASNNMGWELFKYSKCYI